MKRAFLIAALIATPVLAKTAAPDWLAIPQRAESDIKLDEGRKPIETLTYLGIKKGDRVAALSRSAKLTPAEAIAMIAMTTSSSMSVNARAEAHHVWKGFFGFIRR